MPKFKDFSMSKKREMKQYHKEAKRCLDRALALAFDDNDLFTTKMKKYFAAPTPQLWSRTSSLVMKTINSMKLAIDTDLYTVFFKEQEEEGTNASMESVTQDDHDSIDPLEWGTYKLSSGKRINVLEAMHMVTRNKKLPMTIYPQFFKLPKHSIDEQSRLQTYLHELSHFAAGTVDYKGMGVRSPYGMSGIQACMVAGHSAENAENIAMFLATFYP